MRLNRFFTERKNIAVGSSVKLQDEDIEHIRKVLRLSKGNDIVLFNGEKEYLAELSNVTKEFVTADVKQILRSIDFENQNTVILFQGLLKSGMFDLIVEKAVEIGINQIIPLECEYSQMKSDVAEKKLERWNKIAKSASKQSERLDIPEVSDPIKVTTLTKEFLKDLDAVYLFTLGKDSLIPDRLPLQLVGKRIGYIIGPEGGFSPTEHKYLTEDLELKPYTLGNSVLRAETAAIVAGGILKFLLK